MAKVSVLIPSYNHARYLGAALDSVTSQTERDLDIIVLDDGSTDDSFLVAKKRAAADGRIRCYRQDNAGTIAVLNKLFAMSSSEFVCQLGSDDLWEPTFVADALDDLKTHPDAIATFSAFLVIDENGTQLASRGFNASTELAGRFLVQYLVVQNCLGALAACIRRSALNATQPFARNFVGVEDWDLWLRLARYGTLRLRTAIGGRYRIHGDNQSSRNLVRSHRNQLLLLDEHWDELAKLYCFEPIVEARVWKRRAWLYAQIGDLTNVAACERQRRRILGPSVEECVALADHFSQIGDAARLDRILSLLRRKKRQIESGAFGADM